MDKSGEVLAVFVKNIGFCPHGIYLMSVRVFDQFRDRECKVAALEFEQCENRAQLASSGWIEAEKEPRKLLVNATVKLLPFVIYEQDFGYLIHLIFHVCFA